LHLLAARETLVKSIQGANFTNILRAAFCLKVFCADFMCLQIGIAIFWRKEISAKAGCKMLVKLTAGVQLRVSTLH